MVKRVVITVLVCLPLLGVIGYRLYATNEAPFVPAIVVDEHTRVSRPYVIKLHAQWCVKCMMTKDVWADIVRVYGDRVHLLVLDFTTEAATEESRVEARRLKLDEFFDEFNGVTGLVAVLDGRTKAVVAEISGSRDFDEYRAAIDKALAASAATK